MELKFMKKGREIKMTSPAEKKLYGYLGHFSMERFKGSEKLELGSKEILAGRYSSREEIKEGIGRGEAVAIDCLDKNFLYFCRKKMAMYLLQIDFDLGEIFGQEITGIMDIREEEMRGRIIGLEEADEVIANYLLWIDEGKKRDEGRDAVEEEEFERWLNS